jgi:GntR family trehalose operon transcriptional repressor
LGLRSIVIGDGGEKSMPKALFDSIYLELLSGIRSGAYPFDSYLPSESELTRKYQCSRNTVRRAISLLVDAGYVQPIHGKGEHVIWSSDDTSTYTIGGLESFKELADSSGFVGRNQILSFDTVDCDASLAARTGFSEKSELLVISERRFLDDVAMALDEHEYLASQVAGLTPEVAAESIYEFLEGTLGMTIAMSTRTVTMERASQEDSDLLGLEAGTYLAVVESQTFSADGTMFEHTRTRYAPDYFRFTDTATRKVPPRR